MEEASYEMLPKDDPHYASIGRVASNWAVLEAAIDAAIAYLAICQVEPMACVTAQLIGPAKRMDALLALFTLRQGSEATRKELKAFQGRIQQLGEDRNRVVHDAICISAKTRQIHKMVITAKGRLNFSFEPISKEQIDAIGDRIESAIHDFDILVERVRKEMTEQLLLEIERNREARSGQNPPAGNPSGSARPA